MNSANKKRVSLTGYSDRLSARPGDTVQFKLSATSSTHKASAPDTTVSTWLTHCICADPNPAGPGIVEHSADAWYERQTVTARQQDIDSGSYGVCETPVRLSAATSMVLTVNVWPTLQSDSIQCMVSVGALSLSMDSNLRLFCQIGQHQFALEHVMPLRTWTQVSLRVSFHPDNPSLCLEQHPVEQPRHSDAGHSQDFGLSADALQSILNNSSTVVIAAQFADGKAINHFNGKIESPCISTVHEDVSKNQTLQWNLSHNMSSCSVPGLHDETDTLQLINFPARAMTGSLWRGQEMSWRHAPELYGAIHFHEDDLVDAGWETTFTWHVPLDMPSGVYVMHIRAGDNEDAIPLFICAPKKQVSNTLCVVIPTFTYAIYGNHARPDWQPSWQDMTAHWNAYPNNPAQFPGYGLSTYNYHSDGSGICHASHRRPLFNLRPGYVTFANTDCSGLRHFQADTHLLAWLDAKQIGFDIITDRELHNEGVACISDYDMVMTTSHPEYHTSETLDALTTYRDTGGHLSYLGGNGFYWRIALHPEQTDILEIRRAEDGIRAWAAEPGEYYQAFDGQYGGLWRRNGRPPQALCGLGFSAQGQFNGSYYRRHAVDESLNWIFDGIDEQLIGDFGLCGGGAAGFELDRADTRLGTPANAHIIATSENHGDDFILVPEEMLTHITTLPGPNAQELLHADIVWFEVPGGGSVFSVGSITFCGSLPHNDFQNSISTLLHNVVKHVLQEHVIQRVESSETSENR